MRRIIGIMVMSLALLAAGEVSNAKLRVTGFEVGINTTEQTEIWLTFTLSDTINIIKSSAIAEEMNYVGLLREAATDSIIGVAAPNHGKTTISFIVRNIPRETLDRIYNGQIGTYVSSSADMPVQLQNGTMDTISSKEFKEASKNHIRLTDKQQSELKSALAGKPSIVSNDFALFREVDEEDSTKAEYVAQFIYLYPAVLGLKNFNMRARGRLSSAPENPLNYGEVSLFYNSGTVAFAIEEREFILSGFVESALYGNQKMDTLSGEFRLGVHGLVPNLIDLTIGYNRLRLKPIVELGVAGAFHSHELPLYNDRKDHMEAFFSIYYYIPVADKFAIVYDAQGNIADFADEDIKFTNAVSFNYDLPLKDLQTLVKWESGQNKFSYETDQRVLIGIVYNYLPDNVMKK